MKGKLSKIINLYMGDLDTPTFTEAMIRTYKGEFMQAMTQDIKDLDKNGIWNTVFRKSVTGAHILPST